MPRVPQLPPERGPTLSQVLSEIWTFVFFSNDMSWAANTVWCYDYLLTLDREIKFFWNSRWSLNKALFFGYRYPPLLNTILDFLINLPLSWQNVSLCDSVALSNGS
ncbi:hypothetical protein DAEQUDRAFT_231050 [Daedalea quercina L-15889]|uniref:DUF6533 domain-containing protein n=1 Tax=Daedalea quercina L-15889 TaxID=1314783 RepID=A0A165QTK7_9APHY|nr:hypothetical protein DAEQUDRAFT_231050 [Daedalea quercina L-15889]